MPEQAQVRLANHLKANHLGLTPMERQNALKTSKRAKDGVIPPSRQQTLRSCITGMTSSKRACFELDDVSSSTRRMPFYPINSSLMSQFRDWLKTGKSRSQTTAERIATDVGKYLMCAEPSHLPDLSLLTSKRRLHEYVEELKRRQLQASGIISKLDVPSEGLQFIKYQQDEPSSKMCSLSSSVQEALKTCNQVLWREKGIERSSSSKSRAMGWIFLSIRECHCVNSVRM